MNADGSETGRAAPRLSTWSWRSVICLVAVIAGGAALATWRVADENRRFREELLQRATILSWALRVDDIASFAGDDTDLGTPRYERFKRQLVLARSLYPDCRFLYVMRQLPTGDIVFLGDSEVPDSSDYSPPGQAYDEATPEFLAVFAKGRSGTEGPVRDRWGSWISASVPLFHPLDDRVVAVLGMDVDASRWRAALWRATLHPAAFSLVLLLIVIAGCRWSRAWKRRSNSGLAGKINLPDLAMTFLAGITLTLLAVYLASDQEARGQRSAFRNRAALHGSLLQQSLFRVGDNYLEGVARFIAASDFVDRREFRTYIGHLLNRPYAAAWAWQPAVADADRDTFEQLVRDTGVTNFAIREVAPDLKVVPAGRRDITYPVCYVEPLASHEVALGLDLAAHPAIGPAMQAAIATRLTHASDPIEFIQNPGITNVIIAFRPVFSNDDSNRLSGLASVALKADVLLYRAMSRQSTHAENVSHVELYQMRANRDPLFLAAIGPDLTTPPGSTQRLPLNDPNTVVTPAFAFGNVYALRARPGPDFDPLYPPGAPRRAAVAGLAFTLLLTGLVGTLSNRRLALEREVMDRTSDLREREASYHGLFNFIRQAIYIQDSEGNFVDVNEGAVRMYGYTRADFIGRSPEFVSAPGRNDMAALAEAFGKAWNGSPQYFPFWGLRKNGETFPKDVWLSKGSYFGKEVVIAIATDVSDRVKADEERERLRAQLEQAQKMESIGRLAGGVAHDFNNMLQAILGNATLALEECPKDHVSEYLEEIRKSAERSADLTRQLLAFASRQPIRPRVIDLNDTISGMLKMLRRLIGEDIQLLWVPGPDLWPVRMDPVQIDQILANLAANARDAIRGVGSLTVETHNLTCTDASPPGRQPPTPAGDYVILSVRDSGAGMDAQTLAHIFEPFYTTKPHGKGVGLGLATVFGIVKQNEGWVRVESTPGVGSVFTIGIPRTRLTPLQSEGDTTPSTVRGGSETILLVEDESSILRFGRESLRRLGYTVLTASTPTAAIDIAHTHDGPIHLLLTDVVLPGMNGRELATALAGLKPDMRCLFMSGYTADIIATRGVLDVELAFIQKPFTTERLAARIREVLDRPAPA